MPFFFLDFVSVSPGVDDLMKSTRFCGFGCCIPWIQYTNTPLYMIIVKIHHSTIHSTPFYYTSSPSNTWNIVSPMEYQIINNQPWMRWETGESSPRRAVV